MTVMADVISETADRRTAFADFLRHIGQTHLQGAEVLIDPLISLVLALAGVDDEHAAEPRTAAQPITYAEHHTKLFQIATGWLGWTPAEAWAASPAEIIEAYKGRVELLASIFGGADAEPEGETELSPEQFRAFVAGGGNVGM